MMHHIVATGDRSVLAAIFQIVDMGAIKVRLPSLYLANKYRADGVQVAVLPELKR